MYNNPYINAYSPQQSIDRINNQIAELEKMRSQMQQPMTQPTNLTQNFQLAPTNREAMRYANSMEEVQREMVAGDTPYFSKDMSIVWIKKTNGEIKTYELKEIVAKDEKDVQIAFLRAKIEELEEGMKKYDQHDANDDESAEDEKPRSVQTVSKSPKKSK